MNKQKNFILSPITDILKDVVSASAGIGTGVETFPLCDYIMQSVFIKMTGFQEQKMKSICWEMASNDYEYRYTFTQTQLGECSTYTDKQKIYTELIKQIEKIGIPFSENLIEDKSNLPNIIASRLQDIFVSTNLSIWAESDFVKFKGIVSYAEGKHFANQKNVLFSDNTLKEIYENHLYRQRNRIAHNTLSYQQNLPTLKLLLRDEHKYENYFVYFFILILIDQVFIELYKKYLVALRLHAD